MVRLSQSLSPQSRYPANPHTRYRLFKLVALHFYWPKFQSVAYCKITWTMPAFSSINFLTKKLGGGGGGCNKVIYLLYFFFLGGEVNHLFYNVPIISYGASLRPKAFDNFFQVENQPKALWEILIVLRIGQKHAGFFFFNCRYSTFLTISGLSMDFSFH